MADHGTALPPLAIILGPLIDTYGVDITIVAFEAALPPLPTGENLESALPTIGQLYPA